MISALLFAQLSAAALAMFAAVFGVGIARVLWAEDLVEAQRTDVVRSQTELALRGQISALESQISIYKRTSAP